MRPGLWLATALAALLLPGMAAAQGTGGDRLPDAPARRGPAPGVRPAVATAPAGTATPTKQPAQQAVKARHHRPAASVPDRTTATKPGTASLTRKAAPPPAAGPEPVRAADTPPDRPPSRASRAAAMTNRAPPGSTAPVPVLASPAPATTAAGEPALRPVDRALMQSWLAANPGWVPPPLPARLRQQLRPGRPLPSGIEGRPPPSSLAMQLTYFPGYRYLAVGSDLVLLAARSGLVVSILPDAFVAEAAEQPQEDPAPPAPSPAAAASD